MKFALNIDGSCIKNDFFIKIDDFNSGELDFIEFHGWFKRQVRLVIIIAMNIIEYYINGIIMILHQWNITSME